MLTVWWRVIRSTHCTLIWIRMVKNMQSTTSSSTSQTFLSVKVCSNDSNSLHLICTYAWTLPGNVCYRSARVPYEETPSPSVFFNATVRKWLRTSTAEKYLQLKLSISSTRLQCSDHRCNCCSVTSTSYRCCLVATKEQLVLTKNIFLTMFRFAAILSSFACGKLLTSYFPHSLDWHW